MVWNQTHSYLPSVLYFYKSSLEYEKSLFSCWLQESVFDFQQFNYNVSQSGFFGVYPSWSLLSFLNCMSIYFLRLGKFLAIFYSNNLQNKSLPLPLSSLSGSPTVYMLIHFVHLPGFCKSVRFSSVFPILSLFYCSSDLMTSNNLSSFLLILSSAWSSLLLSLSNEFFQFKLLYSSAPKFIWFLLIISTFWYFQFAHTSFS